MSFSIPTLKSFRFVNAGSSVNWLSFCNLADGNGSYGITVNGSEFIDTSYNTSVSINFIYSYFADMLAANPGATLTYTITSGGNNGCTSQGPFTGTVTNGMSPIVINYAGGCTNPTVRGAQTDITLKVDGMPSNWWNNFCCTPYGKCGHNGLTTWNYTSGVGFELFA